MHIVDKTNELDKIDILHALHVQRKENLNTIIDTNPVNIEVTNRKEGNSRRQAIKRRKILRMQEENRKFQQKLCLQSSSYLLPSIQNTIAIINQSIKGRTINYCMGHFGFVPNRKLRVCQNVRNIIGGMTLTEYHSHNSNMKCHNLCASRKPPQTHAKLLGLGAKFCIQSRKLDQEALRRTIHRFRNDARVRYYVQTNIGHNDGETPTLCIKNTNYAKIPKAPAPIEGALVRFERAIKTLCKRKNKTKNTNLTRLQQNVLHYFQNHPEFVILQADKNLGPCAMSRENYVSQCIKQHLSNERCYKRITEEIARKCIDESMEEFFNYVKQPGMETPKEDMRCLQTAAETWTGMAAFYCLPKVHKHKTPTPLRPVVSTLGSPLYALGKWATEVMKPLSHQISTNIKDSDDLIAKLKALGPIESNECFFTSDAVVMHPKKNTEEAIASLILAHETDLSELGENFPIKQLIRALRMLMKHNVFKFSSTCYSQQDGTAIG